MAAACSTVATGYTFGLNQPKMGRRLLKCTEKVLLRLKFDEEHDAVGPGIVISNLGAKKYQKHANKTHFLTQNFREKKHFKSGFTAFPIK